MTIAITNAITPTITPPSHAGRAFALKYGELRARVRDQLETEGWTASRIANLMVAFNGWLQCHDLSDDQLVGSEMQQTFDSSLLAYQDWLCDKGIAIRTQRDRMDFLLLLRKQHLDLASQDELPTTFGEALRVLMERDSRSAAAVARDAGIPKATLSSWLDERYAPGQGSALHVQNLETVLGIPRGTLISRLVRRPYFAPKTKRSGQTSFGKRMSQIVLSGERVRIVPTDRLQEQWQGFLMYKTDPLLEGADAHGLWRTKEPHRSGLIPQWYMMVNDQICPTAGAYWTVFSGYLGWLTRPPTEGAGVPENQADTLAWLVHSEHLLKHVRWRMARAGNVINHGTLNLLSWVKSVLRPETGYLWRNPSFADTLPDEFLLSGRRLADMDAASKREAWQLACATTHDALVKRIRTITKSDSVKFSRDPEEPIQAILAQPEPLRVLLDMIQTMQTLAPRKRYGAVFWVWLRDLLLMKMMCTNPLRISQIAVMTYRTDNTGNLYKTSTDEWRLRYKASDFKNQKGAAKLDYDVSIPRSVWPTIEAYLSESRPHLIGANMSDFLFLPMNGNAGEKDSAPKINRRGMWHGKAISRRVLELTIRYLPNFPPFSAHAIRHIVATDYLKRVPGDYPTVARLLHDELSTVLKNYAHVDVDSGLRRLHDYVEGVWNTPRTAA